MRSPLPHWDLTGNEDTGAEGGGGIKSIGKVTLCNTIVAGNTPDNISGPFTATGINFTEGVGAATGQVRRRPPA